MEDGDLRDAFAASRARDHAAAPAFVEVVGRKRRPPRRGRRRALAVALALVAVVVVIGSRLRNGTEPPAPESGVSIVNWRGPTDFLLETPGRELLGSVPAIGRGFEAGMGGGVSSSPRKRRPS